MKTATNPETGEKVVYLDGKWQAFTKTATNEEGKKAFLVDNSWKTEKQLAKEITGKETPSMEDLFGGAVEPLLTLGSGAVAAPIAEVATFGSIMNRGLGFDTGDPKANREAIYDALMYKPRTEGGQKTLEFISAPFKPIGEFAEYAREESKKTTDSDLYSEGTRAMIEWLPAILGGRQVSGRPVSPKLDKAVRYAPEKIGRGGKAVGEMVANRMPGGKDRIITEMLRDVSGNRIKDVKLALENAPRELTAGQAAVPAKSHEFSALAKMAEEKLPSEFGAIAESQQAGRIANLRKIADTVEKQQYMKNIRKGVADNLYAEARKGDLPKASVSGVVDKIDSLIESNPGNPKFLSELSKARKGLVDKKEIRTNAQEVMSTVDGLRVALDTQGYGAIKGQLSGLKKDIAGLSEKYKQAEKFYAETSRPITQMDIGQELIDTITPKLGSQEKAAAYANAVKNQQLTMKKATGKKPIHGELSKAMTESQMDIIGIIGKELDANVDYKSQALSGRKKMNEVVGTMWDMPKARILERTMVILNTIIKRIEGRGASASIEYFAELSKPKNRSKLLRLIDNATPEEKAVLLEASRLRGQAITSGAIVGAEQEGE